jgi:hypothetical protein
VCERKAIHRSLVEVQPKLLKKFGQLLTGQLPWPLYLYGLEGRGKTRAVLALLDYIMVSRIWSLSELMDLMRACEAPWQTVWGDPGGPQLAAVDEIGMHVRTSDFEYDALYRFAEWREDRPAIYISNHPPTKIRELYDGRLESRLTCGTEHELLDVDRRLFTPEWLKERGAT